MRLITALNLLTLSMPYLPPYQDFHHDVTLKQVLMIYLDSVKCHESVHEKEIELADGIIK